MTELAMFAGSNGGLWVTNGTAKGTFELTPVNGSYSGGLFGGSTGFSPDFTVFNGDVLFEGMDTGFNRGLWLTDGTAAGTHELTGISGAYAGGLSATAPGGLLGGPTNFAPDFTVLSNQVLFQGLDSNGTFGLWVTDGTSAGTHELTVSGANADGLLSGYHAGFTVYNGDGLFEGIDSLGDYGLWMTDGTAAGTHEITGISGAVSGGVLHGLNADFVVLNGKVLFEGIDAANDTGLWVTDGTAAGTHELTGINGAFTGSGGLFGGPPTTHVAAPPDFTAFNGIVLFNGLDVAGQNGLWLTNGTAAGTHEIAGISGANAAGISPEGMTVFKNEVLFAGLDLSGKVGLWVTNGTAAGTHELIGIKGAYSGGLHPQDLTVLGNKVFFFGMDVNGQTGLWVTNGTAVGTHEVVNTGGADLTAVGSLTHASGSPSHSRGILSSSSVGFSSVVTSGPAFTESSDLPVGGNYTNKDVSQADAPLPASAPDFAAKPYGPAKGGLPAQLPNLPDLLVRANFSLINDSMPFDLIGSTTLSTQAGHMAPQAFSNLPDVIDTISLDFLQKNNALLLAQHIASFDANQSGPSSSPGITLPESASPQALLVANFGPH